MTGFSSGCLPDGDGSVRGCLGLGQSLHRDHASVLTASVSTLLEYYHSVYQCVKSMVLAHAHVGTGIVDRAALANDDVACHAFLSTENLYA